MESDKPIASSIDPIIKAVSELPPNALATYARLWQLEIWIRRMVYIELRAAFGNSWQQKVASPGNSLTNDRRLTHMPSPEQNPISYVTFGILLKTVENNWNLFEGYLPPYNLWASKMEEVSQIRNRIAHFRRGHVDDLDRVLRLMRDIDRGFWNFCTSYNDAKPILPPTKDPVIKRFAHLNQFPFVRIGKREWAMAGVAQPDATFTAMINVLRRPWLPRRAGGRVAGEVGYLYDFVIAGRDGREFNYPRYLEDSKSLHGNIVHICLDSYNFTVRATIPAILGTRCVNNTIQGLIDCVPNALHRKRDNTDKTHENERLSDEWPEYVLGPKNPLSFLGPDMPCSFFSV